MRLASSRVMRAWLVLAITLGSGVARAGGSSAAELIAEQAATPVSKLARTHRITLTARHAGHRLALESRTTAERTVLERRGDGAFQQVGQTQEGAALQQLLRAYTVSVHDEPYIR